MAERTRNRVTGMLLSRDRRVRYARLFACLALCVSVVVAAVLHLTGIAMVHEETVLTCPVTGAVAHAHDASCYDEDGELVCPLPELEAHVHTDECYAEVRELACGLEESDEHRHTDECYAVSYELVCGRDEVTEEHVHGPGCFTTVTVRDDDPSSTDTAEFASDAPTDGNEADQVGAGSVDTVQDDLDRVQGGAMPGATAEAEGKLVDNDQYGENAEDDLPAQEFEAEILDDSDGAWVRVSVRAPEGAFPAGTTMKVEPIDGEALRDAVDSAIQSEDETLRVKQMRAVDIKFYDRDGAEIEPAKEVEVEITSPAVRDIKDPVLVHVDEKTSDARIVERVSVVNQRDADATTGGEDTLRFDATEFSPYVIVETETIGTEVITASGETYEVSVSYGPEAKVPDGATLMAEEVTESEEQYDSYARETADALYAQVADLSHLRIFDISILDEGGAEFEPKAPVEVTITYVGEAIENARELQVVHLADTGTEVIVPVVEGDGEETDTVTFTAESFSLYAIAANGYGITGNLDGRSLAIVHVSTNPVNTDGRYENNRRTLGQALMAERNGDGLDAENVTVERHDTEQNVVTSTATGTANPQSDATVTRWTFVATGNGNTYRIKAGDSYLYINSNEHLRLTNNKNDASVFNVVAGTGNDAGTVSISTKVGNKRYYMKSSVSRETNANNGNNPQFTLTDAFDDKYCYMTLAEINLVDPSAYNAHTVYTGTKISVGDLQDGGEYLIYRNVYNETTGEYEDYVIDGNGKLVRAYDKGDIVTLHSKNSVLWTLHVCVNAQNIPTGYYVFKNAETGNVLHPLYDGTCVAAWTAESINEGVKLAGRDNGKYTSTIEYWNGVQSSMAYYGYAIKNEGGFMTLKTATGSESQEFSFAQKKADEPTVQLNPVATVDSTKDGINIHMFNYPDRNTIANVTGSDGWAVNVLPEQHVKATLGSDGYPQFTNGKSGSALFSPSNSYHQGKANHLFLDSVYQTTGYYEYSSFDNFAKYDRASQNFIVYDEIANPNPTSTEYYYRRGNFMPYNEINTNIKSTNLFNDDGDLLDYEDPTNGKPLYGLNGTDYQFGMTMDFNFMMPFKGRIAGNPLIYEFNGDDDLWVYVDGVLLLDIGGVHDAWSGSINFETGEIVGRGAAGSTGQLNMSQMDSVRTTIKACFKAAGVFPDGSKWDNAKVNQYFNGDTFVDFGSHTFNMFYMEHGAGASTLVTRFNLPVIQKGDVAVAKKLDNTSQTDFANVQFAFQAFKVDGDGHEMPMTHAVKAKVTDGDTYEKVVGADGKPVSVDFVGPVEIGGVSYNDVFYLKPNEAAIFSDMAENQNYYVRELGIKKDYYDEVYINGVKIDNQEVEAVDNVYPSSVMTARNRSHVVFTNHCNEKNTKELRITKRLEQGTRDVGDTFEFRVLLESRDGDLVPYKLSPYYVVDDNGCYYRYEDGKYVSNFNTPYAIQSGPYGTIANVPADYTVVIEDLLAGTDFFVDEIRVMPAGSSASVLLGESNWTLVSRELEKDTYDAPEIVNATFYDYATDQDIHNQSSLGRIKLDTNAQVVFTNALQSTDVRLRKEDDKGNVISGSTFNITRWDGQNWADDAYVSGISPITPGGISADGVNLGNPCLISKLACSRYRLEEVGAPAGYNILTKYVYFEVYKDGDGFDVKLLEGPESEQKVEAIEGLAKIDCGEDGVYTISIVNTPGVGLPNTGGIGTKVFTISGGILVVSALAYGLWSMLKVKTS